jgi:hypothetical protein
MQSSTFRKPTTRRAQWLSDLRAGPYTWTTWHGPILQYDTCALKVRILSDLGGKDGACGTIVLCCTPARHVHWHADSTGDATSASHGFTEPASLIDRKQSGQYGVVFAHDMSRHKF